MLPSKVDLCVVGAGTAGAALSYFAASQGLRVLCLDRRALGGAGARWVNGVSRSDFETVGLDLPKGDELRGEDTAFHLTIGRGPQRLTLRDHGVLEVDMRHFVRRLQTLAKEAGAVLVEHVTVEAVDGHMVRTAEGEVEATIIADASGLRGAGVLASRPVRRDDLCAAAQSVFAVADPAGARAFLDQHGVAEDETLCFSGVAGGYSILNVRVVHGEVGLLTGSIPADGHSSGSRLIEAFVAEQPWVGERLFGGARTIPLGPPQPVLARGHRARIGDAAGQVFAAHGSGIGPGMQAAKLLADTLAQGGTPQDYATQWMRTHGGVFAAYDCFRRFSQRRTLEDLRTLFRTGLIDEPGAAAALGQRLPEPDAALLARVPAGLWRAGPGIARDLAATVSRMIAAMATYRVYPRSGALQPGWSRLAARLDR